MKLNQLIMGQQAGKLMNTGGRGTFRANKRNAIDKIS
jgi:hypothetical protein